MISPTHYSHFAARMRPPYALLSDRRSRAYLWNGLRERFPETLAAVLMPNHLHLVTQTRRPEATRYALACELRGWTRRFHPGQALWERLSAPERMLDEAYLKRTLRYVHLNPCRAGLVRDPLQWEWSTHQDVAGCIADPWPDLGLLAEIFRTTTGRLGEVFHRYVSGDPSVSVMGTEPVAKPVRNRNWVVAPGGILRASAIAARGEGDPARRGSVRTLAVQVGKHLGLAYESQIVEMSRSAWERTIPLPEDAPALQAVLRLLTDQRLLNMPTKTQQG